MNLFEWLFTEPAALRRQTAGPLYKQRVAFLTYLRDHDRKYNTLRAAAVHLLHINRTLGFGDEMHVVTMEELKSAAREWAQYKGPLRRRPPGKCSYEAYMHIARGWLRFNSCLAEPRKMRIEDKKLTDFEKMVSERYALAPSTIAVRVRHISSFLSWISGRNIRLRNVSVGHAERYLDARKASGWAIPTLALAKYSLETFFHYGEERGWVRPGLWLGMPTYAIPRHAFTPKGPCWKDVQRMLASSCGKRAVEIRDHAFVLLMAVYGLRVGDVVGLQLGDVDFSQRILTVRRRKNLVTQRFPLNQDIWRTLRRYVESHRPSSVCPALFTTFVAPYKPLTVGTIYHRIRKLFIRNKIDTRCKGPHALRHACADRLMKTGTSVPEIAAFLGHKDTNTVREYTRYNHKALRKIAEFSLKGLS
jgi:integrase/recombinase XerD